MSAATTEPTPDLFGSEDITPFDIGKFLALMEHAEVKAALFKLIDEREQKNANR